VMIAIAVHNYISYGVTGFVFNESH
jgi:hypothetical protein